MIGTLLFLYGETTRGGFIRIKRSCLVSEQTHDRRLDNRTNAMYE